MYQQGALSASEFYTNATQYFGKHISIGELSTKLMVKFGVVIPIDVWTEAEDEMPRQAFHSAFKVTNDHPQASGLYARLASESTPPRSTKAISARYRALG